MKDKQTLIVPMHVNGLFVDKYEQVEVIDCKEHFEYIKKAPLGIHFESSNTTFSKDVLKPGVHLHWVLPDSLRQGVHDEKKDITIFPPVWNCYQVVRMIPKGDHSFSVKTMVLESDYLFESKTSTDSPALLYQKGDILTYGYMARQYEYGKESNYLDLQEINMQDFTLTALGSGIMEFNGYYAKSKNIFSFYDPLDDVSNTTEVNYVVIGYFSHEHLEIFKDCLTQKEMIEKLHSMHWKVKAKCKGPLTCISEGMIKVSLLSQFQEQETLQAAIGHNAIDALSTRVSNSRYLQLLCTNHLNTNVHEDTILQAESDLHLQQFTKAQVDMISTLDSDTPISKSTAFLLDNILLHQRLMHRLMHQKTSLQRAGKDLWDSYFHLVKDLFCQQEEKEEKYLHYLKEMQKLEVKCQNIDTAIEQHQNALTKLCEPFPHLKEIEDSAYWTCNNPTVMVQGNGALRNYEYGFELQEDALLCRLDTEINVVDPPFILQGSVDSTFYDLLQEAGQLFITNHPDLTTLDKVLMHTNLPQRYYVSLLWKVQYFEDLESQHWQLQEEDYQPVNLQVKEDVQIMDRCVVTPQVDTYVKASLQRYYQNHRLDNVHSIIKEMGNIDVLSQTLGTFNEQLTGRKTTYQTPIVKPDSMFYLGDCFDDFLEVAKKVIGNQTALSIMHEQVFHYLRAGKLKVTGLQLIDTFGQVSKIAIDTLSISEAMEEQNEIILPPRILQPARLLFQWGDATHSSYYPILAWVRYNHMQQALIVYLDDGSYIGTLKVIHRAVKFLEGKVTIQDPVLASWITLITKDETTFNQTLNVIEIRQNQMKSSSMDTLDESMYIGRPLALMKASLLLEVMGEPLKDYQWCNQEIEVSPLVKYPFTIRIGDARYYHDGLVGFYLEDTFHSECRQGKNFKNNEIKLTVGQSKEILMLMDISLETTITTGILPKQTITFSNETVKNLMLNMDCSFPLGPTLQPTDQPILAIAKDDTHIWTFNGQEVKQEYPSSLTTVRIEEGIVKLSKKKE